jgi:hypothetical protein
MKVFASFFKKKRCLFALFAKRKERSPLGGSLDLLTICARGRDKPGVT